MLRYVAGIVSDSAGFAGFRPVRPAFAAGCGLIFGFCRMLGCGVVPKPGDAAARPAEPPRPEAAGADPPRRGELPFRMPASEPRPLRFRRPGASGGDVGSDVAAGMENAPFGPLLLVEFMKLRPLLVLLLFVVSGGILVWLYYTATRKPVRSEDPSWEETLADLDACCRRKHAKSLQYDRFAEIADAERRCDAARLFRALACSERLQESNCADAIVRLGGSYSPPVRVVVFHGTTQSNLRRSIDYVLGDAVRKHGSGIERALERGNRYAARVLIWAAAGERRHVLFLERCHTCAADSAEYLLCPQCGNLYDDRCCDPYCPLCLTAGRSFIRIR